MTRETWFAHALCRTSSNPDLFFPPRGRQPKQTHRARQICAQCPVRQQCLDYALRHRCDYGIWGGKTAEQRQHIRRNQ